MREDCGKLWFPTGARKGKDRMHLLSIVTLIRAMVVNDKCPTGVPHHAHVPWRPLYLYIGVVVSATLTRFTSTVVPRSNFRCALPRPSVRFARLVLSPRVVLPLHIPSLFISPFSISPYRSLSLPVARFSRSLRSAASKGTRSTVIDTHTLSLVVSFHSRGSPAFEKLSPEPMW